MRAIRNYSRTRVRRNPIRSYLAPLLGVVALQPALLVPSCGISDGHVILRVTLNEIPEYMNGTTTARHHGGTPGDTPIDTDDDYDRLYRLMVPEAGFTIDLSFECAGLFRPIDPSSLVVTSERSLGAGTISAGENLASYFDFYPGGATWKVSEQTAFPIGANLLRASVSDVCGVQSQEVLYRFDVSVLEDYLNPFTQRDVWLLDFDRDQWTTTWTRASCLGPVTIESVQTPNGTADFDEAMEIVGFRSDETGAGAATVRRGNLIGTNAISRQLLMEEIRGKVRDYYHVERDGSLGDDSVNIDFVLSTDPDAPEPPTFSTDGDFSIIAVGGDHRVLFGQAAYDPNNQREEALIEVTQGVFVTNALRLVINTPIAWLFLGSFTPGMGTPIGESDLDAVILSEDFDRATSLNVAANVRYDSLMAAMDLTTQAVASIVAHEIGHSLGLVANGFPPHGLFGGETMAAFAGSRTNHLHLDTEGNNLMAAGVHDGPIWEMIDLSTPFFNEMNLAYLRQRLIYYPQFDPSPFREALLIDLAPEEQIGAMWPPDSVIEYPITLSSIADGELTLILSVEAYGPISSPMSAALDRTEVILDPQGSDTVTLTVSRHGQPIADVYEVHVVANVVGSAQSDTVVALTFLPGWNSH